MTTPLTHQVATPPATHTSVLRTRLAAVAGAVVAALAVWAVASTLAGIDLEVRSGDTTQVVGAGFVVFVSLLASLLGWALLALLEKRTARARGIWTVIAIVVLVLSLGGPLASGVTAGTKISLALMHAAVAAVLIPVLRHTSPTR